MTSSSHPTQRIHPLVTAALLAGFGLAVAALGAWRPSAVLSASVFLLSGWLVSLIFKPGERRRRWRTLVLVAAVAAPAALAFAGVPRGAAAAAVIGAGAALAVFAALREPFARGIQAAWLEAAEPVGWAVSAIILTLTFAIVIVPMGIVLRLAGHDPLRGRKDPGGSCWVPLDKGTTPGTCFRQF